MGATRQRRTCRRHKSDSDKAGRNHTCRVGRFNCNDWRNGRYGIERGTRDSGRFHLQSDRRFSGVGHQPTNHSIGHRHVRKQHSDPARTELLDPAKFGCGLGYFFGLISCVRRLRTAIKRGLFLVKSIFNGAGYLLADDRCSGGVRDEADMLGCSHCQRLMRKREWQCDGGFCHSCDAPVCSGCADRIPTKGCEVFLRVLEGELEREYRRSQNARLLGIDYT